MADLGARLVAAGLVTRDQLADALASLPPHGGVLAAELVRRGVEEDALAGFFVADGYGPLPGAEDIEKASHLASSHFSPKLLVEMLALPLRPTTDGLVVAMADPSDEHVVRELRHALGRRVVPTAIRLSLLVEMLRRLFPAELEEAEKARALAALPLLDLDPDDEPDEPAETSAPDTPIALTQKRPKIDSVMPLARVKPARRRKRTGEGTGTRERVEGPPPTGEPRARRSTADLERDSVRKRRTTGEMAPGGAVRMTEVRVTDAPPRPDSDAPGGSAAKGSDPAPSSSRPPADPDGWADLAAPDAKQAIARRAARARSVLPTRLPRKHSRSGRTTGMPPAPPPELGTVLASLRATRSRDEACRLACAGVAGVGRCALLLVLKKGVLEGREGTGEEMSPAAVQNLWIPVTSRSILRTVVESGEPYLGPHGKTSADAVFRAAIGNRGGEVLFVPVVLSGKTVSVLCVDEPTEGLASRERAEVVARALGDTLKRIIVSGKSG